MSTLPRLLTCATLCIHSNTGRDRLRPWRRLGNSLCSTNLACRPSELAHGQAIGQTRAVRVCVCFRRLFVVFVGWCLSIYDSVVSGVTATTSPRRRWVQPASSRSAIKRRLVEKIRCLQVDRAQVSGAVLFVFACDIGFGARGARDDGVQVDFGRTRAG